MAKADKILVTGAAGFIGFHLCRYLLASGHQVCGVDNLNEYYDIKLKIDRLNMLRSNPRFAFEQIDLVDIDGTMKMFREGGFRYVIHLAAQAGVRYSIDHPHAYIQSNVVGFLNVLEGCRHNKVEHLIYASSSSVYGANRKLPFSTKDAVDHPVSLYAATKKSNELMAHCYSALYQLPTTGLRFFTVYGPWGRPDMALFLFTQSILARKPIEVFNNGKMKRDFTYIDDIVNGIVRLIGLPPVAQDSVQLDPSNSFAPFKVYNIGSNSPVELMQFVKILEKKLGMQATIDFKPMQDGDVSETFADIDDLIGATGFRPSTSIETGIGKFVDWYLDYYSIKPGNG